MANNLYDAARAAFARGQIDWETVEFAVVLVDADAYTLNAASHANLSDIPAPARVGTPVTLTNTVVEDNGAVSADDLTFPDVTGPSAEALVIYQVGATDDESGLIAYIDTATGLPITPNSGNIIVAWDTGANKIFRL